MLPVRTRAKKSVILIVAISIFLLPAPAFSEKVTLTTIMPIAKPLKRTFYWNESAAEQIIAASSIPQWPPASGPGPAAAFGVSIPVKSGDIVEVMFTGSICGKASTATPITMGSAVCILNEVAKVDTTNASGIWKTYIIRSLYRAGVTETLRFEQLFWYGGMTQDQLSLRYRYCSAEILGEGVLSPAL